MSALQEGSRVLRKGWERYPDHEHLARYGRVLHIAGPTLVEVRWDAGEFGAPTKDRLEKLGELTHVWWRST